MSIIDAMTGLANKVIIETVLNDMRIDTTKKNKKKGIVKYIAF